MGISRARQAIWLNFWLVVALLWAPSWGQWHGIEHRDLQAVSAPADGQQTQAHEHTRVDSGVGSSVDSGADRLGHVAGSELCQVLDHLGHSDRLITASTAWSAPKVPAQTPLFLAHLSFDHDRWSQPQARAPPALI